MPKFTNMMTLDSNEQLFAKEQAAEAWRRMQDKFIGVGLEPAILKIIEQAVSMGMLRIKARITRKE